MYGKTHLSVITSACRHRNIKMSIHLCRKIFASLLRQEGIQPEVIDLLQGRVSTSVLTKHYLAPPTELRERVLDSIEELEKAIR
ncbi:MAG TPA: integrase [Nitrososphaeraceae archaeon]|nr:integrase [Nitrososphaeraceae archaeon]